ncbi:LPS biosynthesis protein [Jannaschia sp. AI_61]|uniref:GumC family protein n=1 Tax=Jannaschia sp. AI_61 TaxID=2829796 RepID=UPI001BC00B82|nr:Wzz/FepE/Etk N-terminal domain-containing protein [Jannaschia sp. AI_61]GIT93294.1 LPS biosynthesis protein [Jannaschia sp. AI_61]
MDLKFYASLFLRRLHWFLLFLIIGTAAGVTLAKVLPPVYVATARLLVESEQIPGELAQSTVQTEATEQLQIIQQRILTRDTLLDMANRLNIYANDPRQKDGVGLDADARVSDLRRRISIVTTGGVQRRGPVQATLVSVRFEAPTGPLSAAVTNELVTMVLREDVTMRTRVARQTLEFFEQEVARLDAELAEQGATILAFKEANQDALPDSLDFRRAQQSANQERLLQLEREEAGLKDRRDRVLALKDPAVAVAPTVQVPSRDRTPEARQLQELQAQLSSQLVVLSPQNPRIKILEARIAALQQVVDAQVGAATPPVAPNPDGSIPDAIDLQLAEIDGQLAFIADQKTQLATRLETLAASIEATPGNTITLETLERDYANVQAQYNQAVANKARAETGDVIESLSKGQRISVVEQAVVPSAPRSPNRPLIAVAGVGGGAALGLAVVILLELLKSGIRRPLELTNKLGISPIATLPFYRTKGEIWRRRLTILSILATFVLGVPAALWTVHTRYMPLDQLIETVGQRIGLI